MDPPTIGGLISLRRIFGGDALTAGFVGVHPHFTAWPARQNDQFPRTWAMLSKRALRVAAGHPKVGLILVDLFDQPADPTITPIYLVLFRAQNRN